MSNVGDVILGARELITDLPPLMPPPTIPSAVAAGGGSLGASTYYLQATAWNLWGESLPTQEFGPVTLTGGAGSNALQVTCFTPAGTVKLRVYIGNAGSTSEQNYTDFFVSTGQITVTVTGFGTVVAFPPSRASSFLPDSDGAAISASSIYRWLNQSLTWAAAKNRGGLPDFSAAGTVGGQPLYQIPGYWKKLDNGWYDGYPLYLARKNDVFRRNPVTGYVGALLVYQATDRLMVECWPQPSRTSGQTTLSSAMASTDTVANLNSAAGFVLGFGLVQIGTEIMEYAAINGSQLTGLTRGMAGTVPAAQLNGAAVTELNLMVSGLRVPSIYSVGSAAATFNLPPGWDVAIFTYMHSRFLLAERDYQSAALREKEAAAMLSDLSANRIIAGPRQIQANAGRGAETLVGLGSPFGGVIVP